MISYEESILKVSEYIERHIEQEITLDDLAQVAAFSKFHFTRIFKACTKEQLSDFIRKRRLTLAAKALLETDISVLQLALTYGYTSQEAFTRAFKVFTGVSPQAYRRRGMHYHNIYRDSLSQALLQAKKEPQYYHVTIKECPALSVIGMPLTGDLDNHAVSKHWNVFYAELLRQAVNPEEIACYGYEALDSQNNPFYLAAVDRHHLSELPNGWVEEHMPQQRYAVFTLANVIENMAYIVQDIYKNQLPQLGLTAVQHYSFEYYEADFKANDLSHPIHFYVPVE